MTTTPLHMSDNAGHLKHGYALERMKSNVVALSNHFTASGGL